MYRGDYWPPVPTKESFPCNLPVLADSREHHTSEQERDFVINQ
jgi:hypothetical protein